jgi:hypothetical protein
MVYSDDSMVKTATVKDKRYLAIARDLATAKNCRPPIFAFAVRQKIS